MNGNAIVGALLRGGTHTGPIVSADRIRAVLLPRDVQLPALAVTTVSVVEERPLRRGAFVRSAARVRVTAIAASYQDLVAVLKAARDDLRGWTGDVAGALRVSIGIGGTGPELVGEGDILSQAQDLRVSFEVPA